MPSLVIYSAVITQNRIQLSTFSKKYYSDVLLSITLAQCATCHHVSGLNILKDNMDFRNLGRCANQMRNRVTCSILDSLPKSCSKRKETRDPHSLTSAKQVGIV